MQLKHLEEEPKFQEVVLNKFLDHTFTQEEDQDLDNSNLGKFSDPPNQAIIHI
jgi:hypothetical protein